MAGAIRIVGEMAPAVEDDETVGKFGVGAPPVEAKRFQRRMVPSKPLETSMGRTECHIRAIFGGKTHRKRGRTSNSGFMPTQDDAIPHRANVEY